MLPLYCSPDGEGLTPCSRQPVCLKASQWGGQNSGVLFLPWDALSSKIQAYMPTEVIQDYSYMVLKHCVLKDQILLNQLIFTSVYV